MASWSSALTIAIVVAGISVVLLGITICAVIYRIRNRRKPRLEKKYLRAVKLRTLELPTGQKALANEYIRHSNEYYGQDDQYNTQNGGIFVNPPSAAPYVDPTPNVKVIRQPNQQGKASVFRHDVDHWGTHNVIHVDGVRNTSPPGSRPVSQQYKAVPPNSKDLYYRLYPQGNEQNLKDYDYIPIKVQPGALGSSSAPYQSTVGGGGGGQGDGCVVVVNHTESNTSINGYQNGELLINAASLPGGHGHHHHLHQGVELRQKRQATYFDGNGSETHSVVQNLSSRADGTPEHKVSLNVVYEE